MIHYLFVVDTSKSVGFEAYNDQKYSLPSELLISLIQSILLLGKQMDAGDPKGELREVEIGNIQISSIEKDHLAYIVIQDTYDNEPFTKKTLSNVIDRFHDDFLQSDFYRGIPNEEKIREEIKNLITTMAFPKSALPEIEKVFEREFKQMPNVDTLLIADLDDGIVNIWREGKGQIIQLLMEILSEIPFERSWIGESRLIAPKQFGTKNFQYEGWVIHRIGLSDFCILGRAYYNAPQRDDIIDLFERMSSEINTIIDRHS
ncbi:MAG: hypothetical protein D6732_09870 [Methanobacteriota archaeon]|nr:MAG: hypothetical protein D6732_09870 [Euryarchaeota archaeon]